MSRTIPSQFSSTSYRMATLVQLTIGSVYRFTDYGVDLTYNSLTYSASLVDIISMSDVQETGALKVNEFNLEMGGAERTMVAAMLANNAREKYIKIYRAAVDANDSVLSAFMLFDGRGTGFSIDDSERESKVSISVASHWADFEKVMNRKTNLNSQQIYFPADLGMQYASKIAKDLRWGRE